jgi:RNA polymerase sigma-70 factor (ECF subfamily)
VAPQPDRPPDAKAAACPCGHGDLPAETAGRPPLLDRAAAGDREAFVRIYDEQVDGVFRYLLAWTGDRAQAAELTGQVFRSAPRWLPATAGGQGEAGAWLIAMARDAVQGPAAGQDPPAGPPRDTVEALGRLGDPQREVAVLRLLCGHSLDHTAQLSGYAVPGYVVGPDDALVRRLRHDLWGSGAGRRTWRGWVSRGWREVSLSRRPWLATAVATAGIMVVLALQAFGDPGPPAACGASPCPAPTTAAAAAGGDSSLGTALTTLAEPPTTSTTGARAATPSAPRTSTAATPPTTRPATSPPRPPAHRGPPRPPPRRRPRRRPRPPPRPRRRRR